MDNSAKFEFTLKGVSPLLFHADDVEQADTLKAWRDDPRNKNLSVPGDDRSPPWTWMTYLYHDAGKLVWPSANVMVCLRQAGAQIVMKKQKTFKEVTQSGLLIDTEFCRFDGRDGEVPTGPIFKLREEKFADQATAVQALGFRLFVKRARVGQSKHVRARARFDVWSVSGSIEVLVPEITDDVLAQIFRLAGRVGQGDWRPGCKTPGPYGMFDAILKKVG
jgi:hypothetical protein